VYEVSSIGIALKEWWPTIIALGAFITLIIANLKYRIPEIVKRIEALESYKLRRVGMHFIEEEICERHQAECRAVICGKMDTQAVQVAAVTKKISDLEKNIVELFSEVKHIIREQQREDTNKIVQRVVDGLLPLIQQMRKE